eukprot:Skav216103  [mRNA]  locus=scaffold2042:326400:331188:- [translate_table: standard]
MVALASALAPLALLVLSVAGQVCEDGDQHCSASLAGGFEDDLALSLQQLRGVKASTQKWSFLSPDPELLVWDRRGVFRWNNTKDVVNASFYDGWLKVPLVHDPALMEYEMPPFVCLRVRGIPAIQQPAKNGPLLVHCGGPGSGRSCGLQVSLEDFDIDGERSISLDFDVLSIDQRGVNTGPVPSCPFKQGGKAVKPFPRMYCNEMKKLMGRPKKLIKMLAPDSSSYASAFSTFVQPIWEARTTPPTGMADYNETFIRWYYRMIKLEHSLCFQAKRYQLKAPNGRNYNALLFGGTVDLAHDLDLVRRAIGAEQLSLYGYSYGTSVASVYASIFPSKTYRLVMDGEVNPAPDVIARADSFTRGLESVWAGLVKDCELSLVRNISRDKICPAAPAAAFKTMKVLEGPNKSQAQSLLSLLQLSVFNHSEVDFFKPGTMACVQQFYSGKEVVGCNETLAFMDREASANQTDGEESDHFGIGIQAMVMGTDTAGRLNEEEVITWWKQTKESAPIGVTWAISWTVMMSTWPAYARPVPPVGDPNLRPVIIGNLHDPQTAYENAQKTKKVFPEGYLVTWQGYGHCLEISKYANALLKEYNAAKQNDMLPAYSNGVARYACMSKILSYLDTGKGLEDGHTCLLPEPVPLGTSAIPAVVMAGSDDGGKPKEQLGDGVWDGSSSGEGTHIAALLRLDVRKPQETIAKTMGNLDPLILHRPTTAMNQGFVPESDGTTIAQKEEELPKEPEHVFEIYVLRLVCWWTMGMARTCHARAAAAARGLAEAQGRQHKHHGEPWCCVAAMVGGDRWVVTGGWFDAWWKVGELMVGG